MKNNRKHIVSPTEKDPVSDFPVIELNYKETKEEVWAKISSRVDSITPQHKRTISLFNYKIALAASLLLLLGMTVFLQFYSKTIYCPAGQHLTVLLPDSSEVELNALSSINFHPFWIKMNRHVNLEGEAYFNVKPGHRFKVISARGETIVLGTTFNIYAREEDYNVSCFTGRVRIVSAINKETIILYANQQAFVKKNGSIRFVQPSNIETNKSWTQNMFVFTSASLKSVLQEIERQYNIKIKTQSDFDFSYTGNFNKSISEKEVLDLVCTTFELKFEVKPNGEYLVYKK